MSMRSSSAFAAQQLDDDKAPSALAAVRRDRREIGAGRQREFELVSRAAALGTALEPGARSATARPAPAKVAHLGLRERKKRFTRETIAAAAFELATEQGLDVTTLDAIAERAFVSPRTISNYFRSKEAAVVAVSDAAFDSVIAVFRSTDSDAALFAALRRSLGVAMGQWPIEVIERLHATETLVSAHPSLLPFRAAQYSSFERGLSAAAAERSGFDAARHALPGLASGVTASVLKTAISIWMQSGPGGPSLAELADRAFEELAAALAAPAA